MGRLGTYLTHHTIDSDTKQNNQKVVSCRVTNSLLRYLESIHYDTRYIVEGIPYSKDYLSDPLNWVPYSVREELSRRASELVDDEEIMYNVGLKTPKFNSISGIEHMVRLVGSPKLAYRSVPKYARLFDKTTVFETKIIDDCKAVVTMSMLEDYPLSRHACYYAQGILAAIPTLWELPPAEVNEMPLIDDAHSEYLVGKTDHADTKCIYEVTWQPILPLYSRIIRRWFKRRDDSAATLKKLEDNFQLLDKMNAELIQRNNQLSKVREIALGIGAAKTIDEVFRLVVESARDIPGVRFIAVNKLDKDWKLITTPYYSKIRNKTIFKTLKAIGFDINKRLGSKPTDNKLVFQVKKLKIAQDYISNPRTIVKEHLSEFLGDVWPKVLCDSIQRIVPVKRFVLLPIMVDDKLWASMFFLLDDDIPVDVLEMIGAHCGTAIKNVSTLETLRLRNAELSSINTIISKTSSSLELDTILGVTVEELVDIFRSDAAGIYLLNENRDALELRVVKGMSVDMINISKGIRLDGNVFSKYFLQQDGVLSGDLSKYSDEFPQHQSFIQNRIPIPFATVLLCTRQGHYGLMTVVRTGENAFTEEEKSILMSIANQLSMSIENAHLHRDVLDSENRLNLTLQSISEGITVTNLEGVVEQVNDAVVKMHGFQTKEELFGLNAFQYIIKDDYNRAMQSLKDTLATGSSGLIEYTFLKKDGSTFPAELSSNLIKDINGNPLGFVACTRDITERRRAESILRQQKELIDRILESTPNAVLVVDKDTNIVLANCTFRKYFINKRQQIEGKPLRQVIPMTDLSDAVSMVLTREKSECKLEFRYKFNKHDKTCIAHFINMGDGQVLILINDVTEERERQERLYLTDRLASVGEMASGVAHELNNPLTGVIGLSQLLANEESLPEDLKEDAQAICSEAKRAATIIKNLLTFARKHTPVRVPTQINKVLEDVLKLRAYEHKVNNIKVNTAFDLDLPDTMADYFQMQQVFLNIILNAEIAMVETHRKGTLTVTTERVKSGIKISLADDGHGIPKENLGRLFDPFFTTKDVGKGTGLGLSICYGIVTGHGGKIYVQSERGKGATFFIELPVNTI